MLKKIFVIAEYFIYFRTCLEWNFDLIFMIPNSVKVLKLKFVFVDMKTKKRVRVICFKKKFTLNVLF